eukprot:TRINITY_DN10286_c0_g1_i2.p1 TRINITY_DN10286_c0_g1~~TRINITY_DN10286_c0_g1_i2.p1  ORF type:complete len:537 (-),score=29.29 TRINITY_DN10286_c0_g1_i2:23-1633(-)
MKNKKLIVALSFIAIILGFFMTLLDTTIVNITLPKMADYFKCDLNKITWISNSYNIAVVVSMLTAARIADQFGRKKLFMINVALFTIISCLIGFSSSLIGIIILRALQGIVAAFIIPVTIPLSLEIIPKEKFGMIIGIWGALAGLAAACGPALGGVLTQHYNWQSVFFVNLPFGIISFIISGIVLTESYDNTASKYIDLKGIITISIAILSLTIGLIQGPDNGWISPYILTLFGVSIISLILFVLFELKSKDPMLPVWLLKIRAFDASCITIVFATSGLMAGSFLVPFYLTKIVGMNQEQAGITVLYMPLSMIIFSAIAGPLSQKIGSKILGTIGILLLSVSLISMGSLDINFNRTQLILRLIIAGIGLGITIAPVIGGAIKVVPSEKIGIASAVTNVARTFGMILGVAVLTTILNYNIKNEMIETEKKIVSNYIQNANIEQKVKMNIINDITNDNNYDSRECFDDTEIISSNISKNEKDIVNNIYSKANLEVKVSYISSYFDTFRIFGFITLVGVVFAIYCENKKKTYQYYMRFQ